MTIQKKQIIRYVAFVLVTVFMLIILSEAMVSTDPTSTVNLKGFYQEKDDSLDAIIFGASEVYTAYSPTLAWKDYGYTSYAYASPGVGGNLYKYMLKEVLRTQKPKVVAFEINGFINKDSYFEREGQNRNVIDNLKWSENRREAIETLIPEEKRLTYYLPLQFYHSRWEHPSHLLANIGVKTGYKFIRKCHLKGTSTYSYIYPMQERKAKGKYHFTERSKRYLKDLMDYCKEQKIENVLFFYTPHGYKRGNQKALKELWAQVQNAGYDTKDFNSWIKEGYINLEKDFYNPEHLNVYGMEKFTKRFGTLLQDQYDLKEEHSDEIRKEWDESVEKADRIFAKVKEDIQAKIVRKHMETSLYITPPKSNDLKRDLNLDVE